MAIRAIRRRAAVRGECRRRSSGIDRLTDGPPGHLAARKCAAGPSLARV